MANNLEDVIAAIKEGSAKQEATTKSVDDLTKVFRGYFKAEKNKAGDLLEASREKKSSSIGGIASVIQQNKEDTSSLGLPAITPLILGLGAWMADLDAYLRALRPDVLLKPVKAFFDVFKSAFDGAFKFISEIKNIRFPTVDIKLPKIQFLNDAGELITDVIDYKVRLPLMEFVDDLGNKFDTFKLKIPELPEGFKNFFGKITGFFDNIKLFGDSVGEKLTIPEGFKNFFGKITGFFGGIAEWFKGIEASIDLKPFLDPIKKALGFADEAGEAGSGLLGFFGKIKGFLGVVLKPIGVVTRILGGPFIQGFLSLLDFVKGFADAFKIQEPTYDEFGNIVEDSRGLGSRIMDGLEGGVKGVIKGIVDAIDLLFLDLPGWILGKLGFENVSKFLMDLNIGEMVDPVWNWIKNIPTMIMDLIPTAEQLKQFVINTIAALPGGYYVLKAIGAGGPELDFAKKNADIEEARAQRQEEIGRIQRSLTGENEYYGSEESGRESSRKKLKELQEEIAQLEKERDEAGRAAGIVNAPVTTTDASTNVQNNTIGAGGSPNPFDLGFGISTLPG
jgi:hypothetical protein